MDRIITDGEQATANRFADSVQTAFFEGHGTCKLHIQTGDNEKELLFSEHFEADGILFQEPSEHLFDFNNPIGACPSCNGTGQTMGIDPDLVVPDKSLSVYDGAITCWKGDKLGEWNKQLIMTAAEVPGYRTPALHNAYAAKNASSYQSRRAGCTQTRKLSSTT